MKFTEVDITKFQNGRSVDPNPKFRISRGGSMGLNKKVDWEDLSNDTKNGWLQIFITKVMQHFIDYKCFTAYGSENTSLTNFASMAWARVLNPELVKNVEFSINEKAKKRQENLEKKIDGLLKKSKNEKE